MSSIEFSMLDEDTQKKLIEEYHRERLQPQSKTAPVAFGTGEHLIFVEYEKGERVLTSNGYIIAGETLEENKKRWEEREKRVFEQKESEKSLVKRLVQKITKINER